MTKSDFSERINDKAERVKLYVDGRLSKTFNVPVICDDDIARVIAASHLCKGDCVIWLNGKARNLTDLQLRLQLESKSQPGIDLLKKLQTLEDE